jgi:ferredoxin
MTAIYYFSGSGNSLAVAKDLAGGLGAELEAMWAHPDGLKVDDAVDAVGFVFPSHDFQAPTFVQSWISRIDGLGGKYVFAVMTYGISAGKGLQKFADLIRTRGGNLSAGFAFMMPHNGIGSALQPPDVRQYLIETWRARRDEVVSAVKERRRTEYESEAVTLGFLRNRSWKMLPGLFRFVGVLIRRGEAGLFYDAGETCNGCGICVRVCPAGNISQAQDQPAWGDACINCFACLHWCPREATHLSARDLKIDRAYTHPDVTLQDMLAPRHSRE